VSVHFVASGSHVRSFSLKLDSSLPGVSWKGRKRFYKLASVENTDCGTAFQVLLDGRAISTPHRNSFHVSISLGETLYLLNWFHLVIKQGFSNSCCS